MKKIILTFQLFIFSSCVLNAVYAQDRQFVTQDELLIRFADTVSSSYINELKELYGAQELDITRITQIRLWKVQFRSTAFTNIIDISEDARSKSPKVCSADPNYITQDSALAPLKRDTIDKTASDLFNDLKNDVCFGQQLYALNNPPSETRDITKIAIMDSGIDGAFDGMGGFIPHRNHLPILKDMYAGGYNFINNTLVPMDSLGHGTHVAGIISQIVKSTSDSNNVKLLIFKTQDTRGYGTLWNLCRAFDLAIDNRASVVNLSLSWAAKKIIPSRYGKQSIIINALIVKPAQPIMEYIINYCQTKNIIVIGAAGNDGANVDRLTEWDVFPAKLPNRNLVIVTSIDVECQEKVALALFANRGQISTDIAAPGTNIYSTYLKGTMHNLSGTSMSTPIVAATAALLRVKKPSWNSIRIKDTLLSRYKVDPSSLLNGQVVSKGILNIYKVLTNTISTLQKESPLENEVDNINVMPNPFTEHTWLRFINKEETIAKVLIYNYLGQLVFEKEILCRVGENEMEWNAEGFAMGIYIVQVQMNQNIMTRKIVKQ